VSNQNRLAIFSASSPYYPDGLIPNSQDDSLNPFSLFRFWLLRSNKSPMKIRGLSDFNFWSSFVPIVGENRSENRMVCELCHTFIVRKNGPKMMFSFSRHEESPWELLTPDYRDRHILGPQSVHGILSSDRSIHRSPNSWADDEPNSHDFQNIMSAVISLVIWVPKTHIGKYRGIRGHNARSQI
jgi:hypothetical protein